MAKGPWPRSTLRYDDKGKCVKVLSSSCKSPHFMKSDERNFKEKELGSISEGAVYAVEGRTKSQ